MSVVTKRLRRLSICSCGYHALKESIQVGAQYLVDDTTMRSGYWFRCGGCGTTFDNIFVVDAGSVLNPEAPLLPLPADLFLEAQ